MLNRLQALVAPALSERLTLVFNHVLASEPAAMARLQPHTGRTLSLNLLRWPALLPQPPALAWRITPAGLLEWCGTQDQSGHDLSVSLDAANPAGLLARVVAGETPAVQIDGDAQLAGEVNWLLQNLRWDVAADLERLFGPAAAQTMQQAGTALKRAFDAAWGLAARSAAGLGERLRQRGL